MTSYLIFEHYICSTVKVFNHSKNTNLINCKVLFILKGGLRQENCFRLMVSKDVLMVLKSILELMIYIRRKITLNKHKAFFFISFYFVK